MFTKKPVGIIARNVRIGDLIKLGKSKYNVIGIDNHNNGTYSFLIQDMKSPTTYERVYMSDGFAVVPIIPRKKNIVEEMVNSYLTK